MKTKTKCYWNKLVLSGTITADDTTLIGEQTERNKPLLSFFNFTYFSSVPDWQNLRNSLAKEKCVCLDPASESQRI